MEFMFNGVISLGLLLGTEAPGMTPNGVDFSFFTFFSLFFLSFMFNGVITTSLGLSRTQGAASAALLSTLYA